ncbi:hypothetical protein [Acidianus bottle-shaped virus 3 strain ABV3]|uniref:Uncharacterized protein n=1 Tax=Acidianus bottle-shaped virus 3 strain ABV3 TaxID=1732174 RepID=A0A0N9NWD1_9VIRU|nr:hypothetical protein AVU00_gp48 [Acidianus bottle-shaped virus 3 strain ABV3]ALG96850.1 hypothetical protein [Acidianus bottle-shaped virus 3 strain ABV3]
MELNKDEMGKEVEAISIYNLWLKQRNSKEALLIGFLQRQE